MFKKWSFDLCGYSLESTAVTTGLCNYVQNTKAISPFTFMKKYSATP